MKEHYKYLLIAILMASTPLLFFGIAYYYKQKVNSFDFKRNVIDSVKGIAVLDLKYNSYYFAGQTNEEIFLGNYIATGRVLKINVLTGKVDSAIISLDQKNYCQTGTYRLYVDSTSFYLCNGVAKSILSGKTSNWRATLSSIHIPYFQQSIPIGLNSMVFSYINVRTGENTLRKEIVDKPAVEDVILKKQVDGIFCTSGILNYNSTLKFLTYVYHYRNQILLIDTNMKLITTINTIDPIDSAKIKVSRINSDQASIVNPNALLVNARATTWQNFLFIQSKLKARNEDVERFKHSAVIDVYDLKKARYSYSLYLPQYQNKPIEQLIVTRNFLIGISDRYLVKYPVRLPDRDK